MKFLFFAAVIISTISAHARMTCSYHHEDGRTDTFPLDKSDERDGGDRGRVESLQYMEVDHYAFELISHKTVYYLKVMSRAGKVLAQASVPAMDNESINIFYDGFFIDCTDDGAVEPELEEPAEETEPVDPT